MTTPARFFCADAARLRGDPLAGTAPYGSVWILIEYRAGWPINGFDGLALEPEVKARVHAAARQVRARVLLIRRHGRGRPDDAARWAVLRYEKDGAHRQEWGTWHDDRDLAQIVDALDAPGERGRPPVVLVCAHGLHDTCCAVRGRPVARALSDTWPQLVWECTHVGGDRFAANVVVAPDGVYYGNLDAPTAVTVVEEHLVDRVHAEHLRGYTDLVPPQQAALSAVLRHAGPSGRHDYVIEETVRDGDRWRIRVAGRLAGLSAFEVEVHAHRAQSHQLTCRGLSLSSAVHYEVATLRVE
ncbi:sucrase ferredoxin [Streptomyces sp. NBC_00233]|uniref:sucrase ferredoxin n=1 Tax=Streptomyces sp. NBC_00233 TaxID=2975686 RepID=UPI0022597F15|nr:sucrase ferredoxin [Streptomyces sp. NBC_00233]MCX5232724.1 sucrase ferredoxin [Streptomyces sp. NBC_00233]